MFPGSTRELNDSSTRCVSDAAFFLFFRTRRASTRCVFDFVVVVNLASWGLHPCIWRKIGPAADLAGLFPGLVGLGHVEISGFSSNKIEEHLSISFEIGCVQKGPQVLARGSSAHGRKSDTGVEPQAHSLQPRPTAQ